MSNKQTSTVKTESNQINGTTGVLGLIGNPVQHTMSPFIHNNLAYRMQKDVIYVPFPVLDDLSAAIKGAYALGIQGLNITVPYKSEAIPFLNDIDETAKRIGAVNTLIRTEHGFKGYNTDAMGFRRELEAEQIRVADRHTIVLGAGGASAAIVFTLADMGARDIILANRSFPKADTLAERVNQTLKHPIVKPVLLSEVNENMPHDDYLVIQCTSVGLSPRVDDCVVTRDEFYKKVTTGVDLIYNPEQTTFMKGIIRNGGHAYNGMKMLIYQAVSAFELFCGLDEIPNTVAEEISELWKKEMKRNE